jgi:hypothetical protein
MGKQKKESVSSNDEAEYGSEAGESMMDYGSDDASVNVNNDAPREVNRANVLNYASDDSSEDEDRADDLGESSDAGDGKRDNVAWGKNKKSYYGKGEESSGMDSSEAEEDQLQEAARLQEIRRKKLARQMAA